MGARPRACSSWESSARRRAGHVTSTPHPLCPQPLTIWRKGRLSVLPEHEACYHKPVSLQAELVLKKGHMQLWGHDPI